MATGSDAIDRIGDGSTGLVVLDFMLPDMTGKEVVLTLTGRGIQVPFIIVTGHGDEKIAVEMMKARDELESRVNELEEFYEMAVGREIRMKELKEEVERLQEKNKRFRTGDAP